MMRPSKKLTDLVNTIKNSSSKEEQNALWESITTPFIEDIEDDSSHKLVTFLYRYSEDFAKNNTKIYLSSSITGLYLSPESQLILADGTDILFLSFKLPSNLRTTYNFLKVDNDVHFDKIIHPENTDLNFSLTGLFKESNDKLTQLYNLNRVELDSRNTRKIVYYVDFENKDKFYAAESILELPLAPTDVLTLISEQEVQLERNKIRSQGRLCEYFIDFSMTSLCKDPFYQNEKRKYWVYTPPQESLVNVTTLPMLLFLDGSDYLHTIPSLSFIERMIHDGRIPPCIAVFFEFSEKNRFAEYDCNPTFSQFIAHEFIDILKNQHKLPINDSPRSKTIIGLSASGLSAFYIGLAYPTLFGNVIAQSPSLTMSKPDYFQKLINDYSKHDGNTYFQIDIGAYENVPVDLQFRDGTIQSISSLEACVNTVKYMRSKKIDVELHEFIGGHNYICYKQSLPHHIKSSLARLNFNVSPNQEMKKK